MKVFWEDFLSKLLLTIAGQAGVHPIIQKLSESEYKFNTEKGIEETDDPNWLRYDAKFIRFLDTINPDILELAEKITAQYEKKTIPYSLKKRKGILKAIIILIMNLYDASCDMKPVRFPKNRTVYVGSKLSYINLMEAVKILEDCNWIRVKKGFYSKHDPSKNYQTRLICEDKLVENLNRMISVYPDLIQEPLGKSTRDLIRLKNADGINIDYAKITDQIKKMAGAVRAYNKMLSQQVITLKIGKENIDNALADFLRYAILKSNFIPIEVALSIPDDHSEYVLNEKVIIDELFVMKSSKSGYPMPLFQIFTKKNQYYNVETERTEGGKEERKVKGGEEEVAGADTEKGREGITKTSWGIKNGKKSHNTDIKQNIEMIVGDPIWRDSCNDKYQPKKILQMVFVELLRNVLGNGDITMPINKLFNGESLSIKYLTLKINNPFLYRSFKIDFNNGGRFYNYVIQGLPKAVRTGIHINGNPSKELDFSGHHFRILYNHKKLSAPKDPYDILGNEWRDTFKLVAQIVINAKSERLAQGALFRKRCDGKITLPKDKNPIKYTINQFKQAHKPIEDTFFTGAGRWLQKMDSDIMEKILKQLRKNGIAGLPIHDSIIVEHKHGAKLREIMISEYKNYIGFEPIIK